MRRNSPLILMSMIILLIVIGVLLLYIFRQSPASDTVTTDTGVPATLTVAPDSQLSQFSEPVGTPIRLIYIVSVLVVFVSAILMLFGMLLKALIKDSE